MTWTRVAAAVVAAVAALTLAFAVLAAVQDTGANVEALHLGLVVAASCVALAAAVAGAKGRDWIVVAVAAAIAVAAVIAMGAIIGGS